MSPATTYAQIVRDVGTLISRHSQDRNSRAITAGLVARAALLQVRDEQGSEAAAEKAYALADEMAVTKP